MGNDNNINPLKMYRGFGTFGRFGTWKTPPLLGQVGVRLVDGDGNTLVDGVGGNTLVSTLSGGPPDYTDPAPDFLFNYRLDGNDSALTPVNSPSIVTGVELPDKLASTFNGVDQYYDSSDLALTAVGTGGFSVVVRFRTVSLINKVLFSTGNGADDTAFRTRATSLGVIQMRINGSNFPTSSGGLNDGDWHQVIYTYTGSGGSALCYIDGSLDNSVTAQLYNFVGTGELQVGAQTGASLFDGDIDGVRFYDRVLSPTEVTALNNNV